MNFKKSTGNKMLQRTKVSWRKLTRLEKTYVSLFVASLLLGQIVGTFMPQNDIIATVPDDSKDNSISNSIFFNNLYVSALCTVTVGMSCLLSNFNTIYLSASMISNVAGPGPSIVFMFLIYAIFGWAELLGIMMFGMTGIVAIEKLVGNETRLEPFRMIVQGVILLLLAAIVETFILAL